MPSGCLRDFCLRLIMDAKVSPLLVAIFAPGSGQHTKEKVQIHCEVVAFVVEPDELVKLLVVEVGRRIEWKWAVTRAEEH